MIGYMRIEDQADYEFERALLRAHARRFLDLLGFGGGGSLLSFDEARASLGGWSQGYRGLRLVEVDRIVGSVGRHDEFVRSFMPRLAVSGARWKRVDLAFHRARDMPPVVLYKIGNLYFVQDGHHRVSVARYHGIETIEALVTEVTGVRASGQPDASACLERGPTGRRGRLAGWLGLRPPSEGARGTC